MTQLMGRPLLGLPSELGVRSLLADLLTGVRLALFGLALVALPVLGLWVLTPAGADTAAGAFRVSCALWLLGHGAPLVRGENAAPLTVTPLLFTALTAVPLYRTGRRIGGRGRLHWRAPLAVCTGYLVVVLAAISECGAEGVLRARPVVDLLVVAAVVPAVLGLGLWAAAGFPAFGRPAALRAAGAGGLGLVAAGGLTLTVALVLGFGAAGRSAAALGGGYAGLLGLLLSCVVLLPNAIVWAAAYTLGPGFAVGTDSVLTPAGGRLGPLPEFPLLALLGEPGGWRLLACALPPLAAAVPALLLGRTAVREAWRPVTTALTALAAALLTGAGAALAAWLAGGALAAGRMSDFGPVPWLTGLAAALWSALVTVPGALTARWWLARTAAPAWWTVSRAAVARVRAAAHRAVLLPGKGRAD